MPEGSAGVHIKQHVYIRKANSMHLFQRPYTFWDPQYSSETLGHNCDTYINFLVANALKNETPKNTNELFNHEGALATCRVYESGNNRPLLCARTGALHLALFITREASAGRQLVYVVPPLSSFTQESMSGSGYHFVGIVRGIISAGVLASEISLQLIDSDDLIAAENFGELVKLADFEQDVLSLFVPENCIQLINKHVLKRVA